jgi:hypothetical protein
VCIHFHISANAAIGQCKLIHGFMEFGFLDIGFAQGTAQALYVDNFFYANSSTLSNFTVFAFYEQEPNSDFCHKDYLICQ